MTAKFRDPISAKACIIVSPPFHRCTPTLISNSVQTCRKCKAGSDDMLGDGVSSERKRLDDFAQWLMNEDKA